MRFTRRMLLGYCRICSPETWRHCGIEDCPVQTVRHTRGALRRRDARVVCRDCLGLKPTDPLVGDTLECRVKECPLYPAEQWFGIQTMSPESNPNEKTGNARREALHNGTES